jgi:hypothetical protein
MRDWLVVEVLSFTTAPSFWRLTSGPSGSECGIVVSVLYSDVLGGFLRAVQILIPLKKWRHGLRITENWSACKEARCDVMRYDAMR